MSASVDAGSSIVGSGKPYVQGLQLMYSFRKQLSDTFSFIGDGSNLEKSIDEPKNGSEESSKGSKEFPRLLKQHLTSVVESLEQLEKLINLLPVQKTSPMAGNMGILAQNFIADQSNQYGDAMATYNWTRKAQDVSNFAFRYLSPLSRQNQSIFRRPVSFANSPLDISFFTVKLLPALAKTFPGLEASVFQRGKNTFAILITLNVVSQTDQMRAPVLKCVILMRSYLMEWINVKAVNEEFFDEAGKLEFTTPSEYQFFQKLTAHLKGTLLSLSSQLQFGSSLAALQPIIKQFFGLLYSYRTTFSDPCAVCKQYLKDFQPPYIRDSRAPNQVIHDTCK